ncbi:MAG TPA: hypothetical protein DCS93_02095 [Microscillaceae bacterium]|nr:hypothetical protein [Microscillaceae bacterium]
MKKIIFSLTLVLCTLAFFSFNTTKSIYPSFVSAELAKFFKGDYIKTVKDEALNLHLEKNFLPLFDDVTFLHAQKNAKEGYYYIVFGTKDGKETMALLKASQQDIETNTYSYIDFSKIKVTKSTWYCRSGRLNAPAGICEGLTCSPHFDRCLGLVCGVWNGVDCDIF